MLSVYKTFQDPVKLQFLREKQKFVTLKFTNLKRLFKLNKCKWNSFVMISRNLIFNYEMYKIFLLKEKLIIYSNRENNQII